MKHAGDAEEAEEIIELAWLGLHTGHKTVVESLRVETGDLVVLAAVEGDDLSACVAEFGKIIRPCPDVGGIERIGDGSVVNGKGSGVPGWVVINNVSEPVLVT